jgi:hypothetical protein
MDKNSWTDLVINEEVLCRIQKNGNILHTVNRRKGNWIGHILRGSYVLNHRIEGKIGKSLVVRKIATGRQKANYLPKNQLQKLLNNILSIEIKKPA